MILERVRLSGKREVDEDCHMVAEIEVIAVYVDVFRGEWASLQLAEVAIESCFTLGTGQHFLPSLAAQTHTMCDEGCEYYVLDLFVDDFECDFERSATVKEQERADVRGRPREV